MLLKTLFHAKYIFFELKSVRGDDFHKNAEKNIKFFSLKMQKKLFRQFLKEHYLMELKRQSGHSGFHLDTSNLLSFCSRRERNKYGVYCFISA